MSDDPKFNFNLPTLCYWLTGRFKKIPVILGILVTLFFILYRHNESTTHETTSPSDPSINYKLFLNSIKQNTEKLACKLPNLEPFDPSMEEMLGGAVDPIICANNYYPLLFTVEDNVLVTLVDPKEYQMGQCCISKFYRYTNQDYDVQVEEYCIPIPYKRTPIPQDYNKLVISCRNTSTSEWLDIDAFMIPTKHNTFYNNRRKKQIPRPEPKFNSSNVVILGLDSISHNNFLRTMPKTRNFLTDKSAFYFSGYSKVGGGSLVNVLPALTGLTLDEIKLTCWRTQDAFFDKCPFIWKKFKREGYHTAMGEDAPDLSPLNYEKNGFKAPPVDFYLRLLYLAQDIHVGHNNLVSQNLCYGPRSTFDVAFEHIQRYAAFAARNSYKYFLFHWINSLFQDELRAPSLADSSLASFLSGFQAEGHLENTVLVLMSNQGMRKGGIRETLQGRIEERLPFLYILLPSKFQKLFPEAVRNMDFNRRRLSTPFDLHETLLDLLQPENLESSKLEERQAALLLLQGENNNKDDGPPRGISLFLQSPPARTCQQAGIEESVCLCNSVREIRDPAAHPDVAEGSQELVMHINAKLSLEPQCAQLILSGVLRAWELFSEHLLQEDDPSARPVHLPRPSSSKDGGGNNKRDKVYEIAFRTAPGSGTFEGSISKDRYGRWSVRGGIYRTNTNKDPIKCIGDSPLKNFCSCLQNDRTTAHDGNSSRPFV